MIKNDTIQPIKFEIFSEIHTYIIKYPKSHYGCFINDLILFGRHIAHVSEGFNSEEIMLEILCEFWTDRNYEIEKV